jgi:hypothetical protein
MISLLEAERPMAARRLIIASNGRTLNYFQRVCKLPVGTTFDIVFKERKKKK